MFNIKQLTLHREKAKAHIKNSEFLQFIHHDIIDCLKPINKNFQDILIISPPIKDILIHALKQQYPNSIITILDGFRDNQYPTNKFDLIIFPFSLHWIENVQKILHSTRMALKKDGIMICNFAGGGSLNNLRHEIIRVESIISNKHTAHISPFIQFDQLTPLLQQAGFIENIIDMESLRLEYSSALSLMKNIQNIGESNALKGAVHYSITKKMYNELKHIRTEKFTDQINLITFVSSPSKNTIKLKDMTTH